MLQTASVRYLQSSITKEVDCNEQRWAGSLLWEEWIEGMALIWTPTKKNCMSDSTIQIERIRERFFIYWSDPRNQFSQKFIHQIYQNENNVSFQKRQTSETTPPRALLPPASFQEPQPMLEQIFQFNKEFSCWGVNFNESPSNCWGRRYSKLLFSPLIYFSSAFMGIFLFLYHMNEKSNGVDSECLLPRRGT